MVRCWLICLSIYHVCNAQLQLSNFHNFGSVLGKLLEKYYTDQKKTILFQGWSKTATEAYYDQLDVVQEALIQRNALIPITFDRNYYGNVQPCYYAVFLVESHDSFHRIYSQLNPLRYDFSGLYTIVFQRKSSQQVEDISLILRDMWRLKIMNVVVMIPGERSTEIFSIVPFQTGSCGNYTPVMVANVSSLEPEFEADLFPDRMQNMFGCPVRAGTYPLKPYTIIREDEAGHTTFKGYEVEMVETIAEHHSFSVEYVLPENKMKTGFIGERNSSGLMKMIQDEIVDLGFGSIGISVERNRYLKSGMSHCTSTFVFAVPPGRSFTSFERLYKPFSTRAWIFLVVAFIGGLVIAEIFFGTSNLACFTILKVELLRYPLLDTWALILGVSLPKTPKKNMSMATMFGWMVASLLVRTLYQGALFKYLHSEVHTKSVQTMKDIDSAGLHYYMLDVTRRFFATNSSVLKMVKRITDEEDPDTKLHQLANGQLDGVVVLPALMIKYFNLHNLNQGYVQVASDIVATFVVCIYYPKNSPFPRIFNEVILRLHAAGILSYWRSKYGDEFNQQVSANEEQTAISLEAVSGIFVIWVCLLFVCIVVFIAEILYNRCFKLK